MIDSMEVGIGMIVQEQGSISGITIAQNIFLGKEERFKTKGFINRHKMNTAAKEALEAIGYMGVNPAMYINSLNMQDRKLVEIAKVMYMRPEILVVDETTTALSMRGREIIFKIMEKMRDDNKAVILISHDLDELMEVCDILTVLRDGKLITTLLREEIRRINRRKSTSESSEKLNVFIIIQKP